MPSLEPSPSSTSDLQVAIVGGGLGGLTLAIALQRAGVKFHIYEAASKFTEIGAAVGLAENAQQAMKLIDPGLWEAFQRHATYNFNADRDDGKPYRIRLGMDGRVGTKTEGFAASHAVVCSRHPNMNVATVRRSDFLEEMGTLVPAETTSFGKRLVQLDPSGPRPRMVFADGTEATADVVVGCDGIKSAVRSSLFGPQSAAQFSGKYTYRGLLPMAKAVEIVGSEKARNAQVYFGYDGHVLTVPVGRGKILNVVACHTKDDGIWDNEQWVVPTHRDEMIRDFAGWGPDVLGLVSNLEKTDKWALFDDPPLETFSVGHVCLLGDAAHATTPHQGGGTGMAIEDAYVLGLLFGMVKDKSESEIKAVFAAYDATRLERSQKVVTTSREAGEVFEFQSPDIGDDLQRTADNLCTRAQWMHEVDLVAMGQTAKEVFEQHA